MPFQGIAFAGRPRSGKSECCRYLAEQHGFRVVSIADPIREAGLHVNPIVSTDGPAVRLTDAVLALGWEGVKDVYPETRRILWQLSEAVCEAAGDDVWTRAAVAAVEASPVPVAVPDVRLAGEVHALRRAGLRVVYVTRPGVPNQDARPGEHLGYEWCDETVHNAGTLGELHGHLDRLVSGARFDLSP